MWYNTISPYSYENNGALLKLLDSFQGTTVINQSYSSKEEGENLLLSIDLPGTKNSDIKVESVVGQVKIFGKQKGKEFHQAYSLPKTYDPSTGVAKLEDGVLTLNFSKFKSAKTSIYNIEVK